MEDNLQTSKNNLKSSLERLENAVNKVAERIESLQKENRSLQTMLDESKVGDAGSNDNMLEQDVDKNHVNQDAIDSLHSISLSLKDLKKSINE